MRLYLDANVIIYAMEGTPPFRNAVLAWIAQAENPTNGKLITSRLSRLECRIKPLREGDLQLLAAYDEFFAGTALEVIDIDKAVIERATILRVEYGLKTPDALHMATAIERNTELFLTGDAALSRCSEIKVEVISAHNSREPPQTESRSGSSR